MGNLAGGAKHFWRACGIAFAVAILIVVATALTVGIRAVGVRPCEEYSESPVRSPDGKWAVTATTKACPAGPLSVTIYSVHVTLAAEPGRGVPGTSAVRLFEAESMAEPPQITWVNAEELRIELEEEGTVTRSQGEAANIRINYRVPQWIWDRLGTIESDRVREEEQSQELFKRGKMTRDDLRLLLKSGQEFARDRTAFRQWVIDKAVVDASATAGTPLRGR